MEQERQQAQETILQRWYVAEAPLRHRGEGIEFPVSAFVWARDEEHAYQKLMHHPLIKREMLKKEGIRLVDEQELQRLLEEIEREGYSIRRAKGGYIPLSSLPELPRKAG